MSTAVTEPPSTQDAEAAAAAESRAATAAAAAAAAAEVAKSAGSAIWAGSSYLAAKASDYYEKRKATTQANGEYTIGGSPGPLVATDGTVRGLGSAEVLRMANTLDGILEKLDAAEAAEDDLGFHRNLKMLKDVPDKRKMCSLESCFGEEWTKLVNLKRSDISEFYYLCTSHPASSMSLDRRATFILSKPALPAALVPTWAGIRIPGNREQVDRQVH